MLDELKFVQGAVSKKDLIPAMTHFAIENGSVRAYNGVVALSSPLPFDIDCKPKALPLVRAITNCTETISLSMTSSGRLAIRSGPFQAFIECIDGETPHVLPEGDHIDVKGYELIEGLRRIQPFIGSDASRPWSNGVLLRGQSMYATNNVVLIEYWMGADFPYVVNLPKAAVVELLRVGDRCVGAQMSGKSMTFHFTNGRWIRTALLSTEWPDVNKILDMEANPQPYNTDIYNGIEAIAPFTDKFGRIFIREGVLHTHPHSDGEEGATYKVEDFPYNGIYRKEMLQLLKGTAEKFDFSTYPDPCIFHGINLRGAIIGMRE